MTDLTRVAWGLVALVICGVLPTGVYAQSTDAFRVGQVLSADRLSKIPVTRVALYEQTVGRVTTGAVLKHGTKDAYMQARGVKSTAGKMFEAMTVNRFRAYSFRGERLVTTASLGLPGDAADLIKLSRGGVVLDRFQLKAGFDASIKAVGDPKYRDIKIATHPEQLAKIRTRLHKLKLQGQTLPESWKRIDAAVRTGRLTDTIAGMPLSTRDATMRNARRYVGRMFDATRDKLVLTRPVTPSATSPVIKQAWAANASPASRSLVAKASLRSTAVLGSAYMGYDFYDTMSRRREFDDDIFYAKTGTKGALLGLGTAAMFTPELLLSKLTGTAILLLAAADVALDRIHENRIQSRQRLLKNLDTYEKHDSVDTLLRTMIEHDNAVLF